MEEQKTPATPQTAVPPAPIATPPPAAVAVPTKKRTYLIPLLAGAVMMLLIMGGVYMYSKRVLEDDRSRMVEPTQTVEQDAAVLPPTAAPAVNSPTPAESDEISSLDADMQKLDESELDKEASQITIEAQGL